MPTIKEVSVCYTVPSALQLSPTGQIFALHVFIPFIISSILSGLRSFTLPQSTSWFVNFSCCARLPVFFRPCYVQKADQWPPLPFMEKNSCSLTDHNSGE